jgi:hypothetical protein
MANMICLLMVFLIIMVPMVLSQRGARYVRMCAETVARADYEHAALLRGDTQIGVHGAFPPAKL